MERQFYNEDFEKFLKNNANQYRMYPSEKVWKGIYSSLHTRRRWYGIGALALLLMSGVILTIVFTTNNTTEKPQVTSAESSSVASSADLNNRSSIPVETLTADNNKPALKNNTNTSENTIADRVQDNPEVIIFPNDETSYEETFISLSNELKKIITPIDQVKTESNSELFDRAAIGINTVTTRFAVGTITNDITIKTEPDEELQKNALAIASQNAPVIRTTKKAPKLTAQVYFTPTVSYRKLSENKLYTPQQGSGFNFSQFVNVNNVVEHKPAIGLEFGIESRYAITKNIAAKAGLQFNINRYDIRAYSHPTEFATIALNTGAGRNADSLTALSNYRNFSGYSPNWLENFYFQVSLPVGAQLILMDNKKVQWGVGGSIQPTYLIGDRAYLITSDYKNYVKVPNLMRRWNVNSEFETFVGYSTGRISWQVGPQVRYQHLSSYISKYPVKENLFDFGLKVGAKINKK